MGRIHNFSAGPSVLPETVLKKAAAEMLNYNGKGLSVMEMSHRSSEFVDIIERAEADLRELLSIPANYKVLFVQGGASTQFSAVPLNLFNKGAAAFIHSGAWSKKAIAEARKFGDAHIIASSETYGFTSLPDVENLDLSAEIDYVHITSNNTIFGTQFNQFPDTGDIPLVADMSSDFLSKPIDVSRFGLIYAGAQKNAGPAGVTIVIIREELIGSGSSTMPVMLDYGVAAKAKSLYNTPPTYAIYIAGLVFEWLKQQGGLTAIKNNNQKKAGLLYDYLDQSGLFKAPVSEGHRSMMNAPFVMNRDDLDSSFIKQAQDRGMINLKGHRSVGGMRASMYNALPYASVEALVSFMKGFENQNA